MPESERMYVSISRSILRCSFKFSTSTFVISPGTEEAFMYDIKRVHVRTSNDNVSPLLCTFTLDLYVNVEICQNIHTLNQ